MQHSPLRYRAGAWLYAFVQCDSLIRRTTNHERPSKYAFRTLLRNRAFTLTAALTLALGIGATTAIFSVVNAVLLQPLPYRDPDRLVVTRLSFPTICDVQPRQPFV